MQRQLESPYTYTVVFIPEAGVPSWLHWGLGGVAGCTAVLKTGFLHRSGASWVMVEMLLLLTSVGVGDNDVNLLMVLTVVKLVLEV